MISYDTRKVRLIEQMKLNILLGSKIKNARIAGEIAREWIKKLD